ncbi:molybdopterin molybdenumtransferase MoeA, partial [Streptomyces sp. NTH33]
MTARGAQVGEDTEDFDVEEALALVNEGNGHAFEPGRGGPGHRATPHDPHAARSPEARHRAAPWPQARETAARAVRA